VNLQDARCNDKDNTICVLIFSTAHFSDTFVHSQNNSADIIINVQSVFL